MKTGKISLMCVLLLSCFVVFAEPSRYDAMGGFSGVDDSFWDTTKYAGIAVDSSSSAAIALDTLTWTQSESSPAIKLNTKPFASLKLILR